MNQLKLNKKQKNKQKITLTLKELQAVKDNATQKAVKITHLFQFIQWEDEEPYNIQELIDEFEQEILARRESILKGEPTVPFEITKTVNIDVDKITGSVHQFKGFDESEETEVKKQEVIKNIKSLARETSQQWPHEEMVELPDVLREIDQLDEPEVLSSDWIKDNQLMWPSAHGVDYHVPANKLYGKLVPKQEVLTDEQIAKKVDQAYKDGYEKGKEHATEKEKETVASVLKDFLVASAKLRMALGMEVEELED